jgi:hypothetical protein
MNGKLVWWHQCEQVRASAHKWQATRTSAVHAHTITSMVSSRLTCQNTATGISDPIDMHSAYLLVQYQEVGSQPP